MSTVLFREGDAYDFPLPRLNPRAFNSSTRQKRRHPKTRIAHRLQIRSHSLRGTGAIHCGRSARTSAAGKRCRLCETIWIGFAGRCGSGTSGGRRLCGSGPDANPGANADTKAERYCTQFDSHRDSKEKPLLARPLSAVFASAVFACPGNPSTADFAVSFQFLRKDVATRKTL